MQVKTAVYSLSALEHWLSAKQLPKNTANTPDIDTSSVPPEAEHNFWSTVPPRSDILCQMRDALLPFAWYRAALERPAETKVANLELAIRIDQKVSRL